MLWLEADRMATLRVDEDTFQRERLVVKEERRMKVENQPYGRLSELIYNQAFTVHPYKHPIIGSMEDLEAASIEDVRAFFRTYYVPTNATLTIVGDFDPDQATRMVEQYFGRIPRPQNAVPRDIPIEPPMTKEKRVTLEQPWPLPAVVVAHHITFDGDPDSYPLHMASKILSDGQSSRIYRKLVYDTGLALTAFGGGNIIEHPNLFFAVGIVQPGHTPEEVEKALIAELRPDDIGAGERPRARAREEPVRARLHSRSRDDSGEGLAARTRRRHPQRHPDGGRRVQHLPAHHGRGHPARGEEVFHAGQSPCPDDHAEGRYPVTSDE